MATYSAGEAQVVIAPDLSEFRERAEAGLAAIDLDLEVALHPDVVAFAAEMQARLEAIDAEIHVPVTPDLDGFAERLRALLATIDADHEINIRPTLDPAAMAAFLARMEQLTQDQTVNIRINQTGGGIGGIAGAAERSRTAALALNAVKFTALVSAAGAAAAAIGGIAGAAGGAVAVLGAVGAAGVVGFQGIGGAFSAMKKASDDAGQAAKDTAKEQEAAADRVREAQQRVKDSIVAQDDAQKRLQATQDTARQKQLALNDAYKEASRSLQDMNDRLRDAELSQESAAIGLARAQERRAQLGPGASALDRAEADLNVRQAQARLDSSRKDTARQQQDTATANSKGVEGSDQVTSAKAGLQSAYDDVTQAQRNVDSTAREAVDAQRELTRALRDQAEAAQSGGASADAFAQALAKLSPNARQFVLAMQALGPQMREFKNAIQDRLFDGLGQSVTTFVQTNLPMLRTGLGQVATYMNGAFKDTLSQLTTTFRILSADGTFAQLGTSIQSAMSGIAPLVNGVVVSFSRMGAAMGTTLGPLFQSLGQVLADIGGPLGQLGASFAASLTPLMPVLGQFIGMLAQGLTPIMPVLSQLLQTLGTALMPIIPTLSGFIVAFGQALNSVLQAVAPLLPPLIQLASAILTPLVGIIKTVADALAPFIKQLAEQMKPVIDQLAPVLAQVGAIMGRVLADAIKQLAPVLGPLVQAFLDLVVAFLPMLPPMQEVSMQLLPLLVEGMKLIIPVITKVIEWFTWFVEQVMPKVVEGLTLLGRDFDNLLGRVRDFVDGAKDKWNTLVDFVKGLPGRISRAATGMWDGVRDTFKSALNWIIQKWNDFNISMKVPDNIPLIGGKGFTINTPDLPMLAGGGAIASRDETGLLSGPGTGTSDSILGVNGAGVPVVRVADQERVTNARSSVANAGLLTAINAANGPFDIGRYMGLPGLADGGVVGDDPARAAAVSQLKAGMAALEKQRSAIRDQATAATDPAERSRMEAEVDRISRTESELAAKLQQVAQAPSASAQASPSVSVAPTPSVAPAPAVPAASSAPTVSDADRQTLGGGTVNESIWALVKAKFPDATLNSGYRSGDPGFHGIKQAIDVGGPMQAIADYAFTLKDKLAQIIWNAGPVWYNVRKNQLGTGVATAEGAEARAIYGEGTMAGHADHVHIAAEEPVAAPAAPAPAPAAPPAVPSVTEPNPTEAATDGVGTTNGVSEVGTSGAAEQKSPFATLLGGGSGSIGDTIGGVLKSFVGGQIDDATKAVLGTSDAPGIVKFGMTIGSSIKQTDTKTGTATAADAAPTDTKVVTPQADAATGVTTPPADSAPAAPPAAPPAPAKIEYNPSGGVEQWRPLVERVLAAKGQPVGLADKVLRRMNQESSGNPKAINNYDINAQNGTPSKSLMQVIDPTFQAYKDPGFDDIWDPEANLRASMNYALARYGSLQAAYDRAGGYADGGSLNFRNFIKPLQKPSGGQALAAPAPTAPGFLSGPGGPRSDGLPLWGSPGEYVVNAVSAQANRALLDGLNRDANFVNNSQVSAPTAAPQSQAAPQQTVMSGRGGNTYVFQVSSVDEALAKVRVEDARSSLGLLSK